MEDVPLSDPIRIGLPEFDNAPLKKRLSWRPRRPQEAWKTLLSSFHSIISWLTTIYC